MKIIGDGEQKEDLLSFVNKNKLCDKVKFLNYKKNIKNYLIESDLFINCSFFEGFPNSVVESLNYNVPVICSRSHGGIFDILKNNKFGYLFDLDKIENLTNLILKFLNDDRSFIKKTKKAKTNFKKFNINNCVDRYESLIDRL